MISFFSDRNFRLLWLGQMCSQFGDRLVQVILVALAASRAAGSTLSLATILVFTSLPALLLNPFAGAYVDRWDRKKTMVACDLVRLLVVLLLPWLASFESGVPLYLAVFLLFAVGAFFVPARLAIIPDVAPPKQLGKANALFATSGLIGSTTILIVGAFLVEWVGAGPACWINGLSYAVSALFIALLRRKRRAAVAGGQTESPRQIFVEIGEGLREMWRHRDTRRLAGLQAFFMSGAGACVVVGTVLVQQSLGSVTMDLGFLSLWMGVGMLLGAAAHSRWGDRFTPRAALGLAFLGCGTAVWLFIWTLMGLKSAEASSIAAIALGFWISPVGIVINTLIHETHPERFHGRIFSSFGVIINLAWIGSMLGAGWLTERGSRGLFMGAVGALFALYGLFCLCYTGKPRKPKEGRDG